MSSIINSYGSYTFPSYKQRAALDSLEERSHLINELLEMSRAPLKQKFREDPLKLLDRTLDALPDISHIAQDLYSDSILSTKPRSVLASASIVNALTLPILKPPLKHITTRKPALEDADVIEAKCQKAIEYLYPKTLADHPWLKNENPEMPCDTEWFVKTTLDAPLDKLKTIYHKPFDPRAPSQKVGIMQIEEKTCVYKIYTKPFEKNLQIPKQILDEERIANIIFALNSPYFPKVLAITSDVIIFEYFQKGDLFDAFGDDSKQNVPPKTFVKYAINIIDACMELKSRGFIHADLKLENCLL